MRLRSVKKTRAMREIEAKHGRPIEEILVEMYFAKSMTMQEIGEALNLKGKQKGSTISYWFARLQIPTRPTLSKEECKEFVKGWSQGG